MIADLFNRKEKKVEYVELIYDLIFVYIIGRNNQLLHNFEGGFVDFKTLFAYALCTLAVIQIWSYTTFYINIFGRNSVRNYVFMFINMYLLYFIGESTRADNWQAFQAQYQIAWGLILLNIALQYLLELRNHRGETFAKSVVRRMCTALFTQALIVFIAAFCQPKISLIIAFFAVIVGIVLSSAGRQSFPENPIDFSHLTERIMLFVVLTFGEMIVVLASYFNGDGSWEWNRIYISLMAFLIVVGLFLTYGFCYDYLIDRESTRNALPYMVVHIFIIFALNIITASLEYMREQGVALMPKIIMLVSSIVSYFLLLLLLARYDKVNSKPTVKFFALLGALSVAFAVLMLLLREHMYINIFISVAYVFGVFLLYVLSYRKLIKNTQAIE